MQASNYLNDLAKEVVEINAANDWNITTLDDWDKDYKILAILNMINSEVAEATEAFRKNDITNFAEELADVIIRTLDLAAGLEIDIDSEIFNKLAKNRTRGSRHGGKRC